MYSILLPTYNERKSVLATIKAIQQEIENQPYEIIICDDNSPDKTAELVEQAFKKDRRVKVLKRTNKKKGLSPSIIDGITLAKGEWIIVMDADGQHPASVLPRLIKETAKHDVVIASRFVKGGSVQGWPKYRLTLSNIASFLARPLLWQNVQDPMSGFFAVKKKLLLPHLHEFQSSGYKILFECLTILGKVRIKEIPYKFRIRKQGESKLGSKVMWHYSMSLVVQATRRYKKLFRFLIVGTSGVIVNMGLLYYLTEFAGLHYLFSSIIAIETAIINNFLWNNYWTWEKGSKGTGRRFIKFNITSLASLVVNIGLLFLLTETGLWYLAANAIGIVGGMTINYVVNDKWTFRN